MTTFAHIITGMVAATTAIMAVAVWQHFHPAPSLAKVDIVGIVSSQQKAFAAQLKPGMDQKAQAAIIQAASQFGKNLDAALTSVAGECKCTIINSAAIIKDSPNAIHDYTQRVRDLTGAKS